MINFFRNMSGSARAIICIALASLLPISSQAKDKDDLSGAVIDKIVAVIGGEMITLSDVEDEVKMMHAQGLGSDKNASCDALEMIMQSKLFLMQARIDSLSANGDNVDAELNQRIDQLRTQLGGDRQVEEYFGKSIYKLRQEWRQALSDNNLIQQEQQKIVGAVEKVSPSDVKQYVEEEGAESMPIIPTQYKLSQICIYPDREAANMAIKERLLEIRERIINGEKFGTLARLYSQDPGSARRGGELGMASKSIFWPAFSDMAMSLKPGIVSQIVETPDGFHIIEVLEKKGDMFNARHILLKPEYSSEDRRKAFATLDSLRNEIEAGHITFGDAARFYSEDPASRSARGAMADPNTGSAYFEIDQLKPQDYEAIKNLSEGEMSQPVESLDNEGRSGNTIYKIIRVDKIIPSHVATFENDYNFLALAAKSKKQRQALKKFMTEKINATRIRIDDSFKDCPFEEPGWVKEDVSE